MQPRLNPMKASPGAYKALGALQAYVDQTGLERSLLELVKIRTSQINGCAYCLAMHTNEARKLGETDDRMHLLNAWHEAPCYSERERAALAWVEAVTLVAQDHVPDETYQQARGQFSEQELMDLTTAIVTINGWNRIAISFRSVPNVKTPAASSSAA
jgi:AhpD family alkylhydroperoxidase